MDEHINNILKIIGVIVAVLGLWFKDFLGAKLGLKKSEKDIENSSLNNLQKNLDIYQEMVSDIDSRYKIRVQEIEENFSTSIDRLKLELVELQTINQKLTDFIKEQKVIITKQNKSLTYYKNKYGEVEK